METLSRCAPRTGSVRAAGRQPSTELRLVVLRACLDAASEAVRRGDASWRPTLLALHHAALELAVDLAPGTSGTAPALLVGLAADAAAAAQLPRAGAARRLAASADRFDGRLR